MFPDRLADLAYRFRPARTRVNGRERLRAFVGAGFGILVTALVARWWAGDTTASPWLAAPLGASAVLVFAVPGSPLAQPWAVIGGNVLSALVGSLCAQVISDPAWAAATAVCLSIALMFALRCLHPPGGATALLTAITSASPSFALFPMLADSVLLVLAGMLYNTLTGRAYPHPQQTGAPSGKGNRFTSEDLDAALTHYNRVLDVSRDDLEELLGFAEAAAYERNFGHLRCRDIMTPEPLAVQFGTTLDEAWQLMRDHRIKALPVINRARRIIGIITVADFMHHAGLDRHEGIATRLRNLIRRDGLTHSTKPENVGQIMTRDVRTIDDDRHLVELVPLFSEDGHHHIPVIDREQRLAGIITQSDLVRALYRVTRR